MMDCFILVHGGVQLVGSCWLDQVLKCSVHSDSLIKVAVSAVRNLLDSIFCLLGLDHGSS